MDNITQARHNFVLAFQYCWNGKEFPIFREISVSERERIHTGRLAEQQTGVKGKEASRAVPVNVDGRNAINALVNWHHDRYGDIDDALNRQTAHDLLKGTFMNAGLNGKLATHSLRKSFAQRVYEQSGDIYLV